MKRGEREREKVRATERVIEGVRVRERERGAYRESERKQVTESGRDIY